MGHKQMLSRLIVKPEGWRPLGRSRYYEDNIKTDPNKTGLCEFCIWLHIGTSGGIL